MLENDDMLTHSDRCRLSNMKVVCQFILKQHSVSTPDDNHCNRTLKESELSHTGTENTDEIFAKAWPVVAAKISDNESRRIKIRGDLVMTTVYNLIRKHLRGSTFDVHNHQPNHNWGNRVTNTATRNLQATAYLSQCIHFWAAGNGLRDIQHTHSPRMRIVRLISPFPYLLPELVYLLPALSTSIDHVEMRFLTHLLPAVSESGFA